jgi:heme exporter protein A
MRLTGSQLRCVRGGREIFARLDFTADAGEPLAVVGANGAGKTSLLRLIAGLIAPAGGQVTFAGGDDDLSPAEQAHYLGHRDALKSALSVMENLAFWRDFCGDARFDIEEALEAVSLGGIGHLPFGYLSTGQRRRTAIARLLVSYRPLWLLDEPTSGLDKASEGRLAGLMKAHCQAGGIIVAATHLPLGLEQAEELRMGGNA